MYDVGMMGNGALAGLVAITSGTSTIYPWGAVIVGFVAGAWYCLGSQVSIWMKVSSCHPPSIRSGIPRWPCLFLRGQDPAVEHVTARYPLGCCSGLSAHVTPETLLPIRLVAARQQCRSLT